MTALALVVAGCGGSSNSPAASADTTSPSASATPTESASASESESESESLSESGDDSGGSANFTKQGTKLKFGEKAIVPFESEKRKGAISVTAVRVTKGKVADLAPLKLGSRAKGLTPYYIHFTVTNESGTDFSFTSLGNAGGLLDDGTAAQGLTVIGTFDPCDTGDAGADFKKKGASYPTCEPVLAGPGASVTGAAYTDYDSFVNTAPDTNYADEPITWN